MKPKHQRLIFVAISVVFLCVASLLVLRAFRDNLVFFYSPSDIAAQTLPADKLMRVGGLVETGSIDKQPDGVTFTITDGKATLRVAYQGILPNLFREGQGVVAEGYLKSPGQFSATRVLAKHDENYMPREVVDALKKSGRWKGNP